MPRRNTGTAERLEQLRKQKARVEAEAGFEMSQREVAEYARQQRRGQSVADRGSHAIPPPNTDFPDDVLKRIGTVVGKVLDIRVARGFAEMKVQCAPDFAHVMSESVLLSGHSLLIDLFTVLEKETPDEG